MSPRARLGVFVVAALGLAMLLGWGVAGLPGFGDFHGAYGTLLPHSAPSERHTANIVAAVVFDYRGVDTIGEELILFCAVMGVALLLREVREQDTRGVVDREQSDALRAVGLVAVPVVVLLALNLIAHGYLTPGGGFQGGVAAAAGLLLVYLAGEWRAFRLSYPDRLIDPAEATGAGGFLVVGLAMLLAGGAFLENLLPLGTFGKLTSGGAIPIENWCVGLEVSAAFVLLFLEFLEEVMSEGR